jgi:hypothetical protein
LEAESPETINVFFQICQPSPITHATASSALSFDFATAQDKVLSLLHDFSANIHAPEPRTKISALQPVARHDLVQLGSLYAKDVHSAIVKISRDRTVDGLLGASQQATRRNTTQDDISYLESSPVLDQIQSLLDRPVGSDDLHTTDSSHWLNLSTALYEAETGATIACSGSISLSELNTPLVLRYDTGNDIAHRIDLTKLSTEPGSLMAEMERLISCCQEATFGFQGRDVLDKDYRQALKMEPTCFDITFHPFDLGIIDAISNLLLPNRPPGMLSASLYKLNVYGPGGKFKSHVDTPRSTQQFGSLVVCLPSPHSGGELVVRHQKRAQEFWWGDFGSSVQWAAFYSDCEHEVLEVKSGFRVTLTYNLDWTNATASLINPFMHEQSLPVFAHLQDALRDPKFCSKGGLVGFHCAHLYPRNRQGSNEGVPFCLKGVDRALWLAFNRFDLSCGVHIVYDQEDVISMWDDYEEMEAYRELSRDTYTIGESPWTGEEDPLSDSESSLASNEDIRDYRQQVLTRRAPPLLKYNTNGYEGPDPILAAGLTFETRLRRTLLVRKIQGFGVGSRQSGASKLFRKKGTHRDQIHRNFEPTVVSDEIDGEGDMERMDVSISKNFWELVADLDSQIFDQFSISVDGIQWMNRQRNQELTLAHLTVS